MPLSIFKGEKDMKVKNMLLITTLLATIVLAGCASLSNRDFPDNLSSTSTNSQVGLVVKNVEIKKLPNKTSYYEGETFDPTGAEIVATWSDDYVENIENIIDYPSTPLTYGMTSVDLTYENYDFKIPVTVMKIPNVTSISVKENPRTIYFSDEKFDSTGLVLTVNYDDGSSKDISEGFAFDDSLMESTSKVTITFGGKTVDIPVEIKVGKDVKFEAEEFNVQGVAEIMNAESVPNENVNNPSGGSFIGALNAHMGSGFSFSFESDKDSIGRLVFSLGKGSSSYQYSKTNRVTISYENSSETLSSNLTIEEGDWYDWKEYTYCIINIKKGLNSISVVNNGGASSNIDYVVIHTDAKVVLSNEEIVLTGNKMECEDMSCVGESYVDREPNCGEPSGGYYIGGMNAAKKGAGVRFMVRSTMDCAAKLTVQISKNGSVSYKFFDHHVIRLYSDDGSEVRVYDKTNAPEISISKGSGWFNWTRFDLLDIDLKEGFTVVEIVTAVVTDSTTRRSGNFDYVELTNITDNSKGFEFFNPTRFEAEDSANFVNATATYDKNESFNSPSGSGFVSNMEKSNSSFSYDINVTEDVTTTIMANIGLNQNAYNFSDVHKVSVTNEQGVESELTYANAKIPSTTLNIGYEWRLFNIGSIKLTKGLNKIVVTHVNDAGSGNFDYLVFGTNVGIDSQYKEAKRYEAEDAIYENATLVDDESHGASENKYVSFGTSKSPAPSLTFEFTVTKETYVTFNLNVGLTTDTAKQITAQYDIIFTDSKGATYSFYPGYNFHKASSNSGYSWRNYVMGFMVAQQGVNKFTIKRKTGASYAYNHGFDYLDVIAFTELA